MTMLVAKWLLMGVCVLSRLRSLLWWACHLDVFLRQSSSRAMSRGDSVAAKVKGGVCVCVCASRE